MRYTITNDLATACHHAMYDDCSVIGCGLKDWVDDYQEAHPEATADDIGQAIYREAERLWNNGQLNVLEYAIWSVAADNIVPKRKED
jgi:hypothetical protein